MTRFRSVATIAVVLAGCLTGCGQTTPSPGGSPAALPLSDVPPTSAWEAVLDHIHSDGTIDRQTALQAFALAVAALPGITVPGGPAGDTDPTAAISMILGFRDQLTPPQRQVVDRVLKGGKPGHPISQAAPSPVGSPRIAAASPSSSAGPGLTPTDTTAVEALARMFRDEESQLLGGAATYPITVSIDANPTDPELVNANAVTTLEPDGAPVLCHITFLPRALQGSAGLLASVAAHEVFHCFQYFDYGGQMNTGQPNAPVWLIEGSAKWVGSTLAHNAESSQSSWARYLLTPRQSLQVRSYDAIGFFAHMAERGIDPWSVFLAMFKAARSGGGAAAFDAGIAPNAASFLDTWGSSYAHRGSSLGPDWERTGLGIPEVVPALPTWTVDNGSKATIQADPFDASLGQANLVADIVLVSHNGHVRLRTSDGNDRAGGAVADGTYCLRSKGCDCPPGSVGKGPSQSMASGDVWLAAAGDAAGSSVEVTGFSLDNYCKQKPPKPLSYPNSCQLLTAADVDGLLGGGPAPVYFPPMHPGDGNACEYHPTSLDWITAWAVVGLTVAPTDGITATMRQGYAQLSGMGDEAYILVVAGDRDAHLWVRSGTTVLWVNVSMGSHGARQTDIALARIAIGHL